MTKYTVAQLNLTWDTEQTKQQYLEIITENGGEYAEEDFLEYLTSNFLEWIRESSDKELLREIVLLDDTGEVI